MQPSQLEQYIPVLFLLAAAVGFAGGTLLISVLLGKFAKTSKAKDAAYECGKDPIGDGTYPWALNYRHMLADHATRDMIFVSMLSFLGILFVGYLYALKKKAFDWKT